MTGQEAAEGPCTAMVNPLWPHRYEQSDAVSANPAVRPGEDTCGRTAGGHAEHTPERIRSAAWGQACWRRAAANAVRHGHDMRIGDAQRELVDEAHAEALAWDTATDDLRRENQRRDDLNQQAREGRASSDPAVRARWVARDEAWTRPFAAPKHDADEF